MKRRNTAFVPFKYIRVKKQTLWLEVAEHFVGGCDEVSKSMKLQQCTRFEFNYCVV